MVKLTMTDEDIVRRAADIAPGCPTPLKRNRTGNDARHKPITIANWCGKPATDLMWRVLPYLGERRSAKVLDILADYYDAKFATCQECSVSFVKADGRQTTYCSTDCRMARNQRVKNERRAENGRAA